MKERIRELWSQSGGHYNRGNQHTWPEYTINNPEKFAELIVRECINHLYLQEIGFNINEEYKLRKHFGVEE